MGNTQRRADGTFSLADYKKKVEKDAKPFNLVVDTDRTITIGRPDANQMFDAEAAMQAGDSRGLITAICGEQADEILDLFGSEDFAVLGAFGEDLQKHFKIGQ